MPEYTSNQQQQQSGVANNIKAINTTVMLLSQKISYLVRNEKILSQNILVLNDKIKKLGDKFSSGDFGTTSAERQESSDDFEGAKTQTLELQNKIKELETEIEGLKEEFVTRKEFQELKYLLESINPLEFVTYKQLKEFKK